MGNPIPVYLCHNYILGEMKVNVWKVDNENRQRTFWLAGACIRTLYLFNQPPATVFQSVTTKPSG